MLYHYACVTKKKKSLPSLYLHALSYLCSQTFYHIFLYHYWTLGKDIYIFAYTIIHVKTVSTVHWKL
jgi:hypothetical protein